MDGLVPELYLANFAGTIILGLLELIWVGNWMRLRTASSPRNVATGFARIVVALASVLLISTLLMSKTAIGFSILSYVVITEFALAITINLIQWNQAPSH